MKIIRSPVIFFILQGWYRANNSKLSLQCGIVYVLFKLSNSYLPGFFMCNTKHFILALIVILLNSSSILSQPNRALEFNGTSSYVDCGNSATLTPSDQITISIWFKAYPVEEYRTILWRGDVSNNYYGFKLTPQGQIRATLFLDQFFYNVFSNTFITNNEWYHVALTFDRSLTYNNMKLYVNGNIETQLTTFGSIRWDNLPLLIGAYSWNYDHQNFYGLLSNLQIWSRALSQEEIIQKMNASLNPEQEQGLEGYWPFNEGEGNILFDHSGNGNKGTIYDCKWYPENGLKAVISMDSLVWKDSDYNGFEARNVDASSSVGEITSYTWLLNSKIVSTSVNPKLEVPTGTNLLTLKVSNAEFSSSDSVYINVYCGELITNGRIYSAPSQLNNSLFISSFYDKVYEFDSTGISDWTFLTGGDILSTIAVGDENNIFVSSTDTRLYSFKNSGIPNWDKAMGGVIASSPAVSTKYNKIYVGLNSGRLFSISYKGDVDWSYQAQGPILASPVIGYDDTIYFGCEDKNVYAIDKNGNFLWKFAAGDVILSSPAVGSDSSVIVNVNDGYLYKISKGELVWKYLFSEHVSHSSISASPVIDHLGNIYIGSLNGCFYSISKDGGLNWKYETNSEIHSTASISPDGKVIYFGNDWGQIYALTTAGEFKWKLQTNQPPVVAPTLVTVNNIVYAGTVDGKVYIIKDIPEDQTALLPVMQWPTYQGNNQRTGGRSTIITSVKAPESLPTDYSLQNYPNPFNPSTKIQYSLASESKVQIRIFNSLGQVIESFEPENKPAGYYQFDWNASGSPSGIYFCTVTAVPAVGGQAVNKTIKMVLLK